MIGGRDTVSIPGDRAGATRLLLVGAGGLGCAAAPVLALAAARGRALTVVVADDDRVEAGNLHRQVLHRAAEPGASKAASLARAMEELATRHGAAPGALATEVLCERITTDNARRRVRDVALVLDGSDNFATRFLVNDACVLEGVPLVHAASIRWQGQYLGVAPDQGGPCYRCLFEAPPMVAAGMSCAEAGVAGPVVGLVGALAAELALAMLAGASPYERVVDGDDRGNGHDQVTGRLIVIDGLGGSPRAVRFRRNPGCLACGAAPMHQLPPPASYEVPHC